MHQRHFCTCSDKNHPAIITPLLRQELEAQLNRLTTSEFIDRQTSNGLIASINQILDADTAARQPQCPYEGLELWVMKHDQGQRVLVPLN